MKKVFTGALLALALIAAPVTAQNFPNHFGLCPAASGSALNPNVCVEQVSGDVEVKTLNVATSLEINEVAITATAAELNILDTVTSTAAELNILDGVTATAVELNMAADESANTEVVTTTNVIAADESGKVFILNSATAFVTTLPAVEVGLRFVFYAGATQVTGGNHTIVPNASDDNTIFGEYLVAGATIPASAEGSINWIADVILPGDRLELFCDGTNWYVSGAAAATGAITFTT